MKKKKKKVVEYARIILNVNVSDAVYVRALR